MTRECEVVDCSKPATCVITPLAGMTYMCDEHAEPYKMMGPRRWRPIDQPDSIARLQRDA